MLDRNALERFVDEYADKAYRAAYALCGNEPDARELVQSAFVRIFDKADLYDESQSLETWFHAVLKNLFRDGRRRYEVRAGLSIDMPIGEDGLTVADALPDAREEAMLDRLEREESAGRVQEALRALPAGYAESLTLVDVEGLGYDEAARILGVPTGTLRSRLCRARAALRERLLEMEVTA